MSTLIACLFALLALVSVIAAVNACEQADQLQRRNATLTTDLACRDARIGDMLAHILGQAADYAVLATTCKQQRVRVDHMLEIMHELDATIAAQARMIELAQQHCPQPKILIYPN